MPDYFGGDARAAWSGTKPQTRLIRVASGQARTIRLDRPIALTEAQEAEVKQDPYVQQCLHRWQKGKAQVVIRYGTFENGRGSGRYEVAIKWRNRYHSALRAARKAMKNRVRERFDEEQPVVDVLRQVHGLPEEIAAPKKDRELPAEQAHAFDLLFSMAPSSLDEERTWRACAVNAVALVHPGGRRRLRALQAPHSNHRPAVGFTPMMDSATKKIGRTYISVDQCLFCVIYRIRLKPFKTVSSRRRHEYRWHFSKWSEMEPHLCPDVSCREQIWSLRHWDNHLGSCHIGKTF